MSPPVPMVEILRASMLESLHLGHAVVWDHGGGIVDSWGDPDAVIFPRSSCKMVQALPLVTSGAADKYGLETQHLALACASHTGSPMHTQAVSAWLDRLGLGDSDLRCGPQDPEERAVQQAMTLAGERPCRIHNNCSGKHTGFLTLNAHMGAGPEYHRIDHPVQQAALAAFEEMTGEPSPTYGIDGCSAPNFATTVTGLARAMAQFAAASDKGDRQSAAATRLTQAMMTHPDLVSGTDRACNLLMRAANGKAAVKTGAEAVYTAILPELRMGVALKIADGATRASECAIAAILVGLGVLNEKDPIVKRFLTPPITDRMGASVGEIRPAMAFRQNSISTL